MTIFCSIGENCLIQGLIDRKGLPTCISPFSWVRCNVDYLIQILEEDFKDFLNRDYLHFKMLGTKQTVSNSKYTCEPYFDPSVSSEFEYTHHNILVSEPAFESMGRKVARFREMLRSDSPLMLMYHHRSDKDSTRYVMQRLELLRVMISSMRTAPVKVLCITQKIVSAPEERRMDIVERGPCSLAVLSTLNIWKGTVKEVFWGTCDDDLFGTMLAEFPEAVAALNTAAPPPTKRAYENT
jgi:hypothetical protein